MKQNSRRPRFLARFPGGSRHIAGGVRFRPELRLLEDRCLPSISLPAGVSPVAQTIGGQFGDFWYERASGATVGHISADGTVAEFSVAGSTPQYIETDVYGNLWTVDPTNGITLNRVTPAGDLLTVTDPSSVASVNALSTPPDSFLPHLLFQANGNADLVVVDQNGDATLVSAPMTAATPALRNAWGPVPVVAQAEGALGQDTALCYPDGGGIDRLSYDGSIQRFSLPTGDTDVVATLGLGPDQNLWFVEASQDSSTGMFYADKIGELFSSGKMVETSLSSQGNNLQVSNFVPAADGSSLWFDQVGLQDDGSNVIGQVNFDKSITYSAAPEGGASLQATAIGPDGSVWSSTSTFDGSQYQTAIIQTSALAFISSSFGDTINLGDTPPTAGNLNLTTNQDTALTGQLPVTPTNGNTLQFSIQRIPDDGTVVINSDGSFTYTPNGGYTGPDSFNFTADDGQGGVAVGTVSVVVNPVNHAPLASDANEIFYTNTPVDDVLPVSDVDGNPLQVTITSGPANGTVNVYGGQGAPGALGDIRFTYTPNAGYSGSDSFTYEVDDGLGDTASGTITFTPYSNLPPTAEDGNVSTYVDNAASGRLPAFDPNGTFLTASIVSQPAHGNVSLPNPGRPGDFGDTSFTYYPNAGYVGTDSFTYQVDDGNGGTATGSISVTISPLQGTTAVYADQHWANLTYGSVVANPDPLNSSAPPAMFGYNAFASINSAISEAAAIFAPNPSAGVVVVNGANGDPGSGIFNEDVVDDSAVPAYIQQGPVTINSLAGNAAANIALHGVNLNTGGDNAWTEYDGVLTGSGGLTKSGSGTLILSGNNTYSGGTNADDGILQVAADANLGTGNVTGSALGTLEFAGSTTTAKSFAMDYGTIVADVGKTVTFNGSQVSSAYLDGAGTFATSATNGAQFSSVTSTPSVTIDSNSGSDQFVNFDNSATLNVAAGINASGASTVNLFNGFTNEGAGNITIGANSEVNVANFHSYGVLTLAPGDWMDGLYTLLTDTSTDPTEQMDLNIGSRTYIGTPATANSGGSPTFDAGIDLNGHNAQVFEALLVNNGFVYDGAGAGTKTVISDGVNPLTDVPALVKGAGFYGNTVRTINGGRFQSGNSPGSDHVGQLVIGPDGVTGYNFCINDATGAAGPTPESNGHVSGWSLVNVLGNFTWTADAADKLTVNLQTLANPTTVGNDVPGTMDNFDPTQSYAWAAIHWTGAYDGPADAAALSATSVVGGGVDAGRRKGDRRDRWSSVGWPIGRSSRPANRPNAR